MTLHRVGLTIALALALASCASPPRRIDESARCGVPDFPYRDGWLGGDAAYSIPVGPRTSLWLFGDSFVDPRTMDPESASESSSTSRVGAKMVHNSIAISTCMTNGQWNFDYVWGANPDGTPRAFLAPDHPDHYWWLFDGFVRRETLYIGLLVVQPSEPRGPFRLPFRFAGVKLARIANFREPPEQWRAEILPLSDDLRAFPVSTLVVEGAYLYLFTFLDRSGDHYPRMLTRLPLAALEGPRPADYLEYLARSGDWKSGMEPDDARLVMTDDASEMSVRFHPEIDRWLAIYSFPGMRPVESVSESVSRSGSEPGSETSPAVAPNEVLLRSARSLEGPWSEPRGVYPIPELSLDYSEGRDPNTFCYAAKEHPQLADRGRLLITYVCNLFTKEGEDPFAVLRRLAAKTYLYKPNAVSIPLPEFP